MLRLPPSLEKLINELSKLPGIGPKSAQRLGFYLLKKDQYEISNLSSAIENIKSDILFCDICHNMANTNPCNVCSDTSRDQTLVCVVEEPMDAIALEKTGGFKGTYHILGGALSPLEGIGPESLNLTSLVTRVTQNGIVELIIATNPSLEGETTALHIGKLLKDVPVKITRIARGLPMGGDLEYADEMTLSRALEGRREL